MVYICFVKKTLIIFLVFPFFGFTQIDFSNQNSFDIVTWNVEWFPKQGIVTVDSVKEIIEIIDAEIIALQEINSVSEFNNLISKLDSYNGFSTNNSNLNLAYVYKKNLNIDSIYTILIGGERKKVIRGGSWKDVAYFLRVSTRDYEYADTSRSFIGFRTVQDYLGSEKVKIK